MGRCRIARAALVGLAPVLGRNECAHHCTMTILGPEAGVRLPLLAELDALLRHDLFGRGQQRCDEAL